MIFLNHTPRLNQNPFTILMRYYQLVQDLIKILFLANSQIRN
jgi:hypothetical protein